MAMSFRLAVLGLGLAMLLSGCVPGAILRCEVFEGDCVYVDKHSYIYLLHPEFFDMREMYVHVETQEGINFGRTTGDPKGRLGRKPNAKVAVKVDVRGVIEFMMRRLEALP